MMNNLMDIKSHELRRREYLSQAHSRPETAGRRRGGTAAPVKKKTRENNRRRLWYPGIWKVQLGMMLIRTGRRLIPEE